MGAFKPLLPFRGATIIETLLATIRAAGIDDIVVVTGREAVLLTATLAPLGVDCVHNSGWEESPMFSSVRIGLERVRGRAEKVFFMPADMPLISRETFLALSRQDAAVAIPTYHGSSGHPVLLSGNAILEILRFSGEGSLRDAIAACSCIKTYIEVDDPGILLDMDTPDDYERALRVVRNRNSI
jgi:CTP:molybdopterin cytidylyltransferase MocA